MLVKCLLTRGFRFWDLMQKLVDDELIDRREIISDIFREKPKELDNYFVAGIIRCIQKKKTKNETNKKELILLMICDKTKML